MSVRAQAIPGRTIDVSHLAPGAFGYRSVFLFALVCAIAAMGIVWVLASRKGHTFAVSQESQSSEIESCAS